MLCFQEQIDVEVMVKLTCKTLKYDITGQTDETDKCMWYSEITKAFI